MLGIQKSYQEGVIFLEGLRQEFEHNTGQITVDLNMFGSLWIVSLHSSTNNIKHEATATFRNGRIFNIYFSYITQSIFTSLIREIM